MTRRGPGADGAHQIYDHAYYHGETSGYSREGYRLRHPDWSAWLELLESFFPQRGFLVDLGCAYGYLAAEARRRGFRAVGIDASDYAVRQEPGFRPFLAQADIQSVPLRSKRADIVCLMDVLEHLPKPAAALREAARMLSPEGIVLGATPDPLLFDRIEPTHCFERPPSYWIEALRSLGLRTAYRFSNDAYNFQFLAAWPSATCDRRLRRFQHDDFTDRDDILAAAGPAEAVLRSGWGGLRGAFRSIRRGKASLYLLNPGPRPVSVSLRLQADLSGYGALRVRWNSHVIGEWLPREGPLNGERTTSTFVVPAGGHNIFLEVFPPESSARVGSLRIETAPAREDALIEALPFDLYQRYRAAADLLTPLAPSSVLDSGGVIGDQDGHLALPRDFFAAAGGEKIDVRSTDIRHCDHPHHIPSPPSDAGQVERRYDAVVSLDVLEHVPSAQRGDYLNELDRRAARWILLGGPLRSPEVERAEARLRSGVMAMRRFLAEHELCGLPERSLIEDFFKKKGYQVLCFPNGWLPRWAELQVFTQHYFAFDDYEITTRFNRLCNRNFYRQDLRAPAYRTLFLISKTPLDSPTRSALARAMRPSGKGRMGDEDFFALHERAAALLEGRREAARDARFLVGERERHIRLFEQTVRQLRERSEAPLHRILWRRLRGER